METAEVDDRNFVGVKPLGAGDLIDRAVRFYRGYFWTFAAIAAPPVVVGTVISVGWTVLGRNLFTLSSDPLSFETTFYYLFISLGTVIIWMTETIAALVVMGGASRNFVRHLLYGEPISFRETYRNVSGRLMGLIAAATIITLLLGILGIILFYMGLLIAVVLIGLTVAAFAFLPVVAVIISIAVGLAVSFGVLWLFFLAASRLAYVPQVMLVEGQGVFAAISRSGSLAHRNVKRLGALFIFSTAAAYSALALLYVPLAWYAAANGVQIMTFDADVIPAWYEIAYTLIGQISFILLSPVWTIGLCLLYVDERVRREGFDIELMAAARLGDIPAVPTAFVNPLRPVMAVPGGPVSPRSKITTLGLK